MERKGIEGFSDEEEEIVEKKHRAIELLGFLSNAAIEGARVLREEERKGRETNQGRRRVLPERGSFVILILFRIECPSPFKV